MNDIRILLMQTFNFFSRVKKSCDGLGGRGEGGGIELEYCFETVN